ncbi:MAG TPA: YfhO family protein, partial [Thermomicrobiales bacterium]|nr:YfhO family protein [Thermomicrobiales bacterium]
ALHGAMPLVIGFALAAAAILPRLEYHTRTNLANGYTGALAWAAVLGGWDGPATIRHLLGASLNYVGGATLALACAALLLAGGRHATPYFAVLAVGAVVLAQRETTWLHQLPFVLLPRFEELHRHWPERVMVIFYLGPAMLAGAAVHAVTRRRRPALLVGAAFLAVLVVLAVAASIQRAIPHALLAGFVALALLTVAYLSGGALRRLVPLLLVLTIFVDLLVVGRFNIQHGPFGGFHKVDLGTYYAPSGAADFLRSRAEDGELARFFGYDPGIHPGNATPQLYRFFFADPRTAALLLNNRATALQLEDIQGYNPVQPQRYVEVMRALNGFAQEYHEANVYPSGLGSPLLNLLNARYLVVPAAIPADRTDLRELIRTYSTVYEDEDVQVLENRAALPRAWLVHEARLVARGEALPLLASGAVDPRRVALVEEMPSLDLAPPDAAGADEAIVTLYEADHLRITVRTDTPALLVLSETADPAWRAQVDGEPVPVLTANHILRAVPVPAGEHTIELRYESPALWWGTVVSLVAYTGLTGVWSVAGWRAWHAVRHRRRCQ